MSAPERPAREIEAILAAVSRPKRAVVTAGMPYTNGPLHLGHLAGAQLPADIHARWLGMLIGRENVLMVCGTDEHGSTSEVAAIKAEVPIREFIDRIHDQQADTLRRYGIGLDVYSGTSRPETFPLHRRRSDEFLHRLQRNGLLEKRTTAQWFDPELQRFLPDRFVRGQCPNPKCDNDSAYADECDRCGLQYDPSELGSPRSALSDGVPVMRETSHLWLNMWAVSETLQRWIEGKKKVWRPAVYNEVIARVQPALLFAREHEQTYKALKVELPAHKMRYAPNKQLALQFTAHADLSKAQQRLEQAGIESSPDDAWGHRAITRDVEWGLPLPADLDPELVGKTLYVWPDSLLAPIAFSEVALKERGEDPARVAEFWCNPEARIYQFVGQDNVFFYVLMQGAMWLGMQDDPHRLPLPGELQLTDVLGCFHLLVEGEKMSKSRGNFLTGAQLLDEHDYTAEQIRYYLAILGLPDKQSNFDFEKLDQRNRFLAGPLNATIERPISAAHSKFESRVPEGRLLEKVVTATGKIVQRYVRAMEKSDYPSLLFDIENYARTINGLFTQYKPHDDRHPEEGRRDALYSSFYVLKNLMIMLYPFVPATMERVRESLRLPPSVFRLDELGVPLEAGHEIGEMQTYFPAVPETSDPADSAEKAS